MAYTERKYYVPESKYSIKCPYTMEAKGITVHETDNNAPAINEAKYMVSNNNKVSFHNVIDDKEVIHCIPHNRSAWHAGDGGSGKGNRTTISYEICYNMSSDLSKYNKAVENAVKEIAKELHKHGWGTDKVYQHNHWSGKNCPRNLRKGDNWKNFLNNIKKELDKLDGKTTTTKPAPTGIKTVSYTVKVTAKDGLNVRKAASAEAGKVRNLKCGTVVKIIGEKNGWGKISNENWINLKYTKKVTTAKEYKIKITATTLNVRSGPSTNYKTVQTLSKNGVYTIVDEKDGWGKLKSGAGWISLKYTEKGQ